MESPENIDIKNNDQTCQDIANTWNENQEVFLKGISERSNCMRWLHTQCYLYYESANFYLTIPNVIISTLNGSFTMSLNSLFPDPGTQKYAITIIGLISILSAVLTTMNQYLKSQQMMESHRAAGLAHAKLYRTICNELAVRCDQRSNSIHFLKIVKIEQDRLESTSPTILPSVIEKFNLQFADKNIEKPELTGDLDHTVINKEKKEREIFVRSSADKLKSFGNFLSSPDRDNKIKNDEVVKRDFISLNTVLPNNNEYEFQPKTPKSPLFDNNTVLSSVKTYKKTTKGETKTREDDNIIELK